MASCVFDFGRDGKGLVRCAFDGNGNEVVSLLLIVNGLDFHVFR